MAIIYSEFEPLADGETSRFSVFMPIENQIDEHLKCIAGVDKLPSKIRVSVCSSRRHKLRGKRPEKLFAEANRLLLKSKL